MIEVEEHDLYSAYGAISRRIEILCMTEGVGEILS